MRSMNPPLTRRQALAGLGTVTLGSLLAVCGGGDDPAPVATVDGGTATVEPKSTETATSGLFDDSSACTLTAEQTEGPYYFDADAIRSDIREDRDGTPLRLAIRVREAELCAPLADAVVEVWHLPGWYPGRTTYIHVKVHIDRQTVLTTQVYFDEETNGKVYAKAPYQPSRDQTNATDMIFDESLLLALREEDDGILGTISFDVRT